MKIICRKPSGRNCMAKEKKLPMEPKIFFPLLLVSVNETRDTPFENRANQQIKQYSPLVETYIQNLRPDKDLGYAPAGVQYFLCRAEFSSGASRVSLTDPSS